MYGSVRSHPKSKQQKQASNRQARNKQQATGPNPSNQSSAIKGPAPVLPSLPPTSPTPYVSTGGTPSSPQHRYALHWPCNHIGSWAGTLHGTLTEVGFSKRVSARFALDPYKNGGPSSTPPDLELCKNPNLTNAERSHPSPPSSPSPLHHPLPPLFLSAHRQRS